MKILITGNPNYSGLCKGLSRVLETYDVTFISRSLGYDLSDIHNVTKYAANYDVLINSTNIPNDGQLILLDSVYDSWTQGHIINVSTTSVYWNNKNNLEYYNSKLKLEERSKQLSNRSIEDNKKVKVSCVAFGQLDTESQRSRNDGRNKIDLEVAAQYVKFLIDLPKNVNINYLCIDPIQKLS